MTTNKNQYDIAFSLSGEDKIYASELLRELGKLKCDSSRIYYYFDHIDEDWGELLDNITYSVYPNAENVLLFLSKNYFKCEICMKELDIALEQMKQRDSKYLLIWYLDDYRDDRIPKGLKFFDATYKPKQIADILVKFIKRNDRRKKWKIAVTISVTFAAAFILVPEIPIKHDVFPFVNKDSTDTKLVAPPPKPIKRLNLSGVVLDESANQPMQGARVELVGGPSVITSADGRFSFELDSSYLGRRKLIITKDSLELSFYYDIPQAGILIRM